jgi:prepilin-type N-terminal cleavage/methylation domain-containing protein
MRMYKKQHGFSLFELSIGISVFGMLFFTVSSIVSITTKTFREVMQKAICQSEANEAITILQNDLRLLKKQNIVLANDKRLVIKNNQGDEISYLYYNRTLYRIKNKQQSSVLLKQLKNFSFSYLNENQKKTKKNNTVYFIDIFWETNINPGCESFNKRISIRHEN